jgi:hypothetical protein
MLHTCFIHWLYVYRPLRPIDDISFILEVTITNERLKIQTYVARIVIGEDSPMPTPAMTRDLYISYLKNPWFSKIYL